MAIDWTTVLFEAINFVVLVLVLFRILYRPLKRGIEARRAALASEAARAKEARESAEQLKSEWQHKQEELDALRASVRAEVLDAAEKERSAVLERAREDASAELARARQLLAAEHEAAQRWVQAAVMERGTDLAGRMLLALAPEAVDDALARELLASLEKRTSELRELTSGESVTEVELCGAHMPERAFVERVEELLERALGRSVRLVVQTDEMLRAGWTLRVGDRLFDASVEGELRAFRELARELEADVGHEPDAIPHEASGG